MPSDQNDSADIENKKDLPNGDEGNPSHPISFEIKHK